MSLVVSLLAALFGLSGITLLLGSIAALSGGESDTALLLFAGTGACISVVWLIHLSREAAGRGSPPTARF